MHKQLLTTFAVAFCSSSIALLPLIANAQTLLTRATVRDLRNQVELFLKEQPKPRLAKKADNMTPGDSLQTYRKAMAELRFNDNSLARIGEQAIFRFIPNTRNLALQKGTVLLLIPPGQGRTQVKTPNAVAGIRGSALFVRYIEDTGVTIVGALTDSAIEISNADGSQTYVLKAGQVGTVYKNQIGVYDFDLKAFYETSPLVKDIDMQGLEAVGQEMATPRKAQVFANNKPGEVLNTPSWALVAENRPGSPLPIATSGISPTSVVSSYDPNKSAYEWSAVLATLKQYSNPVAQPLTLPTAIAPQPPVVPSLPVQPALPDIPAQVTPAIPPPARPLPAPATPPVQVATPPITPPNRPVPAPITPPSLAPAPPPPTAIQPATPPLAPAAPPVVAPPQTAVISTPAVSIPLTPPVAPAIPAIPAVPATPTTPAVPATPPAAAIVITAPQVTPNLDLPSVQPGSAVPATPPATTTPVTEPVRPTP